MTDLVPHSFHGFSLNTLGRLAHFCHSVTVDWLHPYLLGRMEWFGRLIEFLRLLLLHRSTSAHQSGWLVEVTTWTNLKHTVRAFASDLLFVEQSRFILFLLATIGRWHD